MNTAEQQARSQLESIVEMTAALRSASNEHEQEAAQTRIQEDPLSVEVRSGWFQPGQCQAHPSEFRILLCTGGPAVQIVGELNDDGDSEPIDIQFQDWFTPWEPLAGVTADEAEALQEYCRQFYFA